MFRLFLILLIYSSSFSETLIAINIDRKPVDIAEEIKFKVSSIGFSEFTNMYCTNSENIRHWDLSKKQNRDYFKQRGYLFNSTIGEASECRLGVYNKWFLIHTSVSSLIVVSEEGLEVDVLKELDLF